MMKHANADDDDDVDRNKKKTRMKPNAFISFEPDATM